MRRTNLRGHALRGEGAAYYWSYPVTGSDVRHPERVGWTGNSGEGFALCECGWTSEVLNSGTARRRAHSQHKEEVRRNA